MHCFLWCTKESSLTTLRIGCTSFKIVTKWYDNSSKGHHCVCLGCWNFPWEPADERCEDVASSEEDPDASGGEADILEIDPRAEDKELKHHLLKKYSGYLSSLRQELSKKRKKGKLPKEARQKLLKWWELHYKWPYPSVRVKRFLDFPSNTELNLIVPMKQKRIQLKLWFGNKLISWIPIFK